MTVVAAAQLALNLTAEASSDRFEGLHTVHGDADAGQTYRLRVWPLGQFFTPCPWNAWRCHRALVAARAAGAAPFDVVGYHRFSASWHSRGRNRYGILTVQDAVWAMGGGSLGFTNFDG